MSAPNPFRRIASAVIIASTAFVLAALGSGPVAEAGQPTLRELIEKGVQKDRPSAAGTSVRAQVEAPDDTFGRGVPRSSVLGFLTAARDRNFARAAEYLDLRNLPSETAMSRGPELARQLKIVLDRVLWIDLERLSDEPQGNVDDHLHIARDRVGTISAGDKVFDILVQQVPREDGASIWKFAGVTVAEIPELYEELGYGSLEKILPAWLFDVSFLGMHLWLWIMLIGLGILMLLMAIVITWFLASILRRVRPNLGQQVEQFFTGPVRLLIWATLMQMADDVIGPSIALRALLEARTVKAIAVAWILLRSVDFIADRASKNLNRRGLAVSVVVFKPVARLLKALAVTIVMLLWLENLGLNAVTLLAGLSISGVAIALASQKTLENVFGAFTLFSVQPVRVGDFCRFGDHMGTVEEMDLRAVRIRTRERSVITIANAQFAGMQVDNLSKRDRFWYNPKLSLRYETRPEQIRYIMVQVRRMLYAHPKVLAEPLHVWFTGFAEYSFDLEVFAYIGVTEFSESREVAGDLNLRIMEIIAAAGTDFAVPTRIEYGLQGKSFDEQRAQAAEAEVKEWKAKRALYLPSFPQETIAEIRGSLDYPPEGSPHYSPARP
jgi:MscS family membrane protein